jgi:hypothetical protein
MADPIYLTKGDDAAQIQVTLTRKVTETPIDLTSGSVKLMVRERFSETNAFTLTATNTYPEDGICVFDFSGGQLTTADVGEYRGQIQFTDSSGNIESRYEKITIIIGEDYG